MRIRISALLAASVAAVIGLSGGHARATMLTDSGPGLELSDLGTGIARIARTAGWMFNVETDLLVTHLGLLGGNGGTLTVDRDVGLWDGSGVLLAAETVEANFANAVLDVDNPLGPGEPPRLFGYVELASPVPVAPGQTYTLGAFYDGGNAPGTFVMSTFTTFDDLVYLGPASTGGVSELTLPSSSAGNPNVANGFIGPNLRFQTSQVPLPASALLLLAGAGGLTLVGRRRRGRRA